MIHLFYKYQGRDIHDQACDHLLAIASKAKGKFTIQSDLDVCDTWICNKCEVGVNMQKLIRIVENEFHSTSDIKVMAGDGGEFPSVIV